MSIPITIDDRTFEVAPGTTVLEAARSQGIVIPTLCYHKDLSPVGSCRMCVVEVNGMRGEVASCTLQATPGMLVQTETPNLVKSRRLILSLMLENYQDAGYPANGGKETEFMYWVNRYGASALNKSLPPLRYNVDSDPNPFVWVDFNKCILCTRCVRACAEIQGRLVWGVSQRGSLAEITAGAGTELIEAHCESCGACVAYCPTGALDNRMSLHLGQADKLVSTTCSYCGVGCQLDLNVKDGKVIRVTSNPESPVNGSALCVKGRYGYDYIHHPDRLTTPKVRRYLLEESKSPDFGKAPRHHTRDEWVDVDWETALDITARKLTGIRDTFGGDTIGVLTSAKCTNEENYLMNKFARQVVGTNNIDHCARL